MAYTYAEFSNGELYSNSGPVCPHCKHEHSPDEAFYFDESTDEMECEACAKTFAVSIYTSTSWTTSPKEAAHD